MGALRLTMMEVEVEWKREEMELRPRACGQAPFTSGLNNRGASGLIGTVEGRNGMKFDVA